MPPASWLAKKATTKAKADGILLFTIGLGGDAEQDALRRMASSPTDYFYAPDGEDLLAIYKAIAASSAPDAHRIMQASEHFGKIVLRFD